MAVEQQLFSWLVVGAKPLFWLVVGVQLSLLVLLVQQVCEQLVAVWKLEQQFVYLEQGEVLSAMQCALELVVVVVVVAVVVVVVDVV